jgi:membrane protease YdiL (CAAX protease family)
MAPARTASFADRFGVPVCFVAAALAFSLLFAGVAVDFWWQMAASVAGLCALAYLFDPPGMVEALRLPGRRIAAAVALGVLSAAVLYGVFYAGNAAADALTGFSRAQVARVYEFRRGAPVGLIVALMALVIGPGEEVFWRGFIQRRLVESRGVVGLALSVLAYGLVHVASGNVMLVAAALVCGAFWGLLYWRFRSIWLNVVSHVLWDLAVFVVWPIGAGR